jgi:peptidoglycan/LPS O-acetylase OafA/YrhL
MGGVAMRRVPEFDSLRGLAALGVLLFHLRPNEGWTHFGMTGVHLFLVLSGFLITRIVIDHVGSPGFLRAFYARRALRIWPIYYLTLAFLVILQRFLPAPPSLRGLPYYLTFTQYTWHWPLITKLVPTPSPPVQAFDHSWTLALEEQFYLLWPLAIARIGPGRVAPAVLGIVAFGLWFKTLGYDSWILFNVFGAFALGALIASMLDDRARAVRHRLGLSTFFLVAGSAGLAYVWWYYTVPVSGWSRGWLVWRDSLQNFAFYTIHFGLVGFVATNAGSWFLAPLRIGELAYLGEISYGMYLYHLPVYWLVGGYSIPHGEPWTMGVGKIALTFVAASLSYRYIEKPILALKDRFPYGPRPVGGPPSAIRGPSTTRAGADRVASGR